jgi:hypothetical protein
MQLISQDNTIEDLVKFVKTFTGAHKEIYQIPWEDIPDYLPRELKTIYHEFGNFPTNEYWDEELEDEDDELNLPSDTYTAQLFDNQDVLNYFHNLEPEGNLITVCWENQGNWTAKTEIYKDDGPVYVEGTEIDLDPGLVIVCPRLSHFLATFCLHELVCGARRHSSVYRNPEALQEVIARSTPLWLDGKYVSYVESRHNYYLTDDKLLLMVLTDTSADAWLASNDEDVDISETQTFRSIPKLSTDNE